MPNAQAALRTGRIDHNDTTVSWVNLSNFIAKTQKPRRNSPTADSHVTDSPSYCRPRLWPGANARERPHPDSRASDGDYRKKKET